MDILAKIVTIIGALLFFTIVFVLGLAFIEYIENRLMKKPSDTDHDVVP